ncbi:MAG: SRPBCC domain-containing protein [Eubacteriales bacterium]
MEQKEHISITVETTVPASPELAWEYWTKPAHITQWNQGSEDWHTPRAENDVRVGENSPPVWSRKTEKWALTSGAFMTRLSRITSSTPHSETNARCS